MASLPRRLLLQSRQCPSRIRSRAAPKHTSQWHRPLSTTPQRCADEDTKPGSAAAAAATPPAEQVQAVASKTESQGPISKQKDLSPEETTALQLARLVSDLKALDPEVVSDAVRKGQHGIPFATDADLVDDEHFDIEEDDKRKVAAGFWAEGEESMGADEDYFGDDLTSHGHGELAMHRMKREYARLIAWEMPLLNQLAKPFTPPTSATPFRFRYTSYLNESHPAANKVVVEFTPQDLATTHNLSEIQVSKLIKLAGPRYNPNTQFVKISCEQFNTQAQNKRHLGETIHALIQESKTGDMFQDVPFDFRHVKVKKRVEFPAAWALTPERKAYLAAKRAEKEKLDDEKKNNGLLVDGKIVVETSLPFLNQEVEAETVPLGGDRGKRLR
ncbi:mitochondrial ribosomal subunit protein-domain-containing protein [Paraphoma chrysanthemicola]|uniref:Mitochondrial ribosomal subunit protein-domain-containing protein n=1 Tax=Paraphoma chrysanthemicola TaxID=798071 RepID=A0A8K0W2L6_9PLEO|nr:mitochondrial ribosomal subunit protein-domain-containing protein [Paraphoma chrysanthemicola]